MIELAIDSSQDTSIALNNNGHLSFLSDIHFGRNADSDFLPCLVNFLKESSLTINDIPFWTVGLGPGSFAGIRFSLALVKGICEATKAQTRGIPGSYAMLQALLNQAPHPEAQTFACIQDARCSCAFVTAYKRTADRILPSASPVLIEPNQTWPAWSQCDLTYSPNPEALKNIPEEIASRIIAVAPPQAAFILGADTQLFPFSDSPDIEPIYVRPPA